MCLILHVYSWFLEKGGISSFFETFTDIVIQLIVIVMSIMGLIFPVWCYLAVTRNFSKLSEASTRERLMVLVEECRISSLPKALYTFFFVLRRFICGLNLVFLVSYPYFQAVVMIVLSFLNLNYIMVYRPLMHGNQIEIFNEASIYAISIVLTWFLDQRSPEYAKVTMTNMFIAMVGFNAGVNIVLTFYDTFLDVYETRREEKL